MRSEVIVLLPKTLLNKIIMASYLKSAAVVSFSTLFSRILGLVRDVVLASVFGASMTLDAFLLAFTVPNLFRRFFGEGALSAAFIPVFTKTLEKKDKAKAFALACKVFSLLIITLTIIVVIIAIFCLLSSSIGNPSKRTSLALKLTALMMPYVILICATALLGSMLNALKHFLFPALAPAVLNIFWLMGIFLLAPFLAHDQEKWAYGMGCAILLGGFFQLAIQYPALKKNQFHFHFSWSPQDEGLREVLRNLAPAIFGTAVLQINVFLDRLIAWLMIPYDGALTILYMSNRLVQFPLALIGISLATVVFPIFTSHAARGEFKELAERIPQSLRLTFFFSLPAGIGLMLLANPIISLIFRHNRFTPEASVLTSKVLLVYASALWIYTSLQIVSKIFYSLGDTITPVRVATLCVIGNLVLNLILVCFLQEIGLALATAINAFLNLTILMFFLRKRISMCWKGTGSFLVKIVISAILMSIAVMGVSSLIGAQSHFWGRLLKVMGPVLVGIIVYISSGLVLQIPEANQIRMKLLKK